MTDLLRLKFEADTDGTGELFAEVRSGDFCGAGSAWFSSEQLKMFAQELASIYPLPADVPLKLEGGFWSEAGDVIDQMHLGLHFYPIGGLGYVGVRVLLSSPIHVYDRTESRSSIAVELHTDYELLREFAHSLGEHVRGAPESVVLKTLWGVVHRKSPRISVAHI